MARFLPALALLVAAFALPASAQSPHFAETGPLTSEAGHALVEWQAEGESALLLSRNPDLAEAEVLYEGTNTALFVSGLGDGTYYLGLRDGNGISPETLRIDVAHQSMTRAFWLTIIGALITLGIIAAIARGARP